MALLMADSWQFIIAGLSISIYSRGGEPRRAQPLLPLFRANAKKKNKTRGGGGAMGDEAGHPSWFTE